MPVGDREPDLEALDREERGAARPRRRSTPSRCRRSPPSSSVPGPVSLIGRQRQACRARPRADRSVAGQHRDVTRPGRPRSRRSRVRRRPRSRLAVAAASSSIAPLGGGAAMKPGRSGRPAAASSAVGGLWQAIWWVAFGPVVTSGAPASIGIERRVRPSSTRRGATRSVARTGSRSARGAGPAACPRSGSARSPASASRRGIECRSPTVYGCDGRREQRRAVVAASTTKPAYMTLIRWVIPATTPRSWVIRISAVPASSVSVAQELEDLRLDRDVEGRRRLVRDHELRLERERHRDHHALAHPAGELVGIALEARLGLRDPDHRPAARSPGCGPRPSSILRWARIVSTICSSIVRTGFRLVIGSWKIIAIVAAPEVRACSASERVSRSWPSKRTRPPSIRPAGFGSSRMIARLVTLLPQPDSPTSPSRLALARARS